MILLFYVIQFLFVWYWVGALVCFGLLIVDQHTRQWPYAEPKVHYGKLFIDALKWPYELGKALYELSRS